MNDLAIHLTENVMPEVPTRHWVCTAPWALRYRLGYDRKACSLFVRAFCRALSRSMQQRANQELGLASVTDAQWGAVTFIQRSDSALRLNPHLHVIGLDGVYVRDEDGKLHFHELPPPDAQEVGRIALWTAERVLRKLDLGEVDGSDPFATDEPLLAHCYGASTQGREAIGPRQGKPAVRLIEPTDDRPRRSEVLIAQADGFEVYTDRRIDARDRQRLYSLCRYLARPPLAQDRLQKLGDGRLCYRFKKPWADGTAAVVLTPVDLIARLCALVPPPRFHLIRFSGVLAPHATARPEVVPRSDETDQTDHPQLLLPLFGNDRCPATGRDAPTRKSKRRPSRLSWSKLLARVFLIDVPVCPRCQGSMRIVEFVINRSAVLDGTGTLT